MLLNSGSSVRDYLSLQGLLIALLTLFSETKAGRNQAPHSMSASGLGAIMDDSRALLGRTAQWNWCGRRGNSDNGANQNSSV